MKRSSLQALNTRGISHLLLPILVVLSVGIVGTYFLVASHADSLCGSGSHVVHYKYDNGQGDCVKDAAAPVTGSIRAAESTPSTVTGSAAAAEHAQATAKSAAKKTERDTNTSNKEARSASSQSTLQTIAATPARPISTTATAQVTPRSSSITVKHPELVKKSGDIIVTTYYDDPKIKSDDGKDRRLGNVKVSVNRLGGDNNCNNHKGTDSKTNNVRNLKDSKGVVVKDKNGNPILIKGTVNYKQCDLGDYKFTVLGKTGYTVEGSNTITRPLGSENILQVSFVLKKN